MSSVARQRESLASAVAPRNSTVGGEISSPAATQFAMHVPSYQAIGAKTRAIHQVFTTASAVSRERCVATESPNASAAG
jgi:hypothetical protein